MKSFFSLLILVSAFNLVLASQINIKYENDSIENALWVKSIFIERYSIPGDLIQIKKGDCIEAAYDQRFLNLCINKKGDLITISQDIKFKINSLLTFR